jgi:hypothetical protein
MSASVAAFALVLVLLVVQMRLGRDPALGTWAAAPPGAQHLAGAGRAASSGRPLRTGSSTTVASTAQASRPLRTGSSAAAAGSPLQQVLRTASSALAPGHHFEDD